MVESRGSYEYYLPESSEYYPPLGDLCGKVIARLEDWFWAIERGTANLRFPDPFGMRYNPEQVDAFIAVIDAFFEDEVQGHHFYWKEEGRKTTGKPIDTPPEFNRLQGASREAFVQAIKKIARAE